MLKAIDYYEDAKRGYHPNRKKDFLIWSAEKMAAYDVADALPQLETTPLLVITSEQDYARADAEWLYANKKGPKQFHVIKGAGHFDLYDLEPYVTQVIAQIGQFFAPKLQELPKNKTRQSTPTQSQNGASIF